MTSTDKKIYIPKEDTVSLSLLKLEEKSRQLNPTFSIAPLLFFSFWRGNHKGALKISFLVMLIH